MLEGRSIGHRKDRNEYGQQGHAGNDFDVVSLASDSERDEQRGYMELFAGAVTGIRNPRGHEVDVTDDPGAALDYLGLASLLLRKLDSCGLR